MPALKFLTPLSFVESAKLSDLEAEETAVKVDEVSNGIGTDVTIVRPIDRSTTVCESLERTSGFSYIWRQLDRNLRGR